MEFEIVSQFGSTLRHQGSVTNLKLSHLILTGAFLPAIPISCNVLKDIALGYPNQDEAPDIGGVCAAIQGIATECGCPVPEEPTNCHMCAQPLKPEFYDLSKSIRAYQ
jgi:hypothetical protein